jgi:hypothetical protein
MTEEQNNNNANTNNDSSVKIAKPNKKGLAIALIIMVFMSFPLLMIFNRQNSDNGFKPTWESLTVGDGGKIYANQTIGVSIEVTHADGIKAVKLSYSNDSKATWHNVSLSNSDDTWSGDIEPQDIEQTIDYKFYAESMDEEWVENNNEGSGFNIYTGDRKAFLVCSANDFYQGEDETSFNGGIQSEMRESGSMWMTGGSGTWDFVQTGRLSPSDESLVMMPIGDGSINMESIYLWNPAELISNAYYNMTGWVNITSIVPTAQVKIGLRWLNSSADVVREDWSEIKIMDTGGWAQLQMQGINLNLTNEIEQLELVLSAGGNIGINGRVYFDDIKISHWISVNATDPFNPNPPPTGINSDGFPAAALLAYKVLKYQGYTDANIFLMLYYTDDTDGKIDIKKNDGIDNDLDGVVIDIANDSINATRFKEELDVSHSGSFASSIAYNDQLIIYIVDHGSNQILPDGNATFHFESDKSYVSEVEFYDLVSTIDCYRMMICVDCCFSGNFLSSEGSTWDDIDNCIFVSSAANVLSWYWIDCTNQDGFAGSWFFYWFWNMLNSSFSVQTVYNGARMYIPFGMFGALVAIQNPLMQDNLGIAGVWAFNSFSRL